MTEQGRLQIELITPEHVLLPFEVASASNRVLALIIDLIVMTMIVLGLVLVVVLAALAGATDIGAYTGALFMVLAFIVRNFYFAFSELRWQGQTIGKRAMGVRVVARDGGPLSASMIFARNLTRDIEVFLPFAVLVAPELLFGEAPGWARLSSVVWLVVLAFLPLFNRHRARLGDLVAGTVVVVQPKASLLPDLVSERPQARRGAKLDYTFTREQLDIYGIQELQVLEEVLRRDLVADDLYEDICERIKRKISWDRRFWNVEPEAFLRAFYAAQRTRLEQKMLLGKRQERKIR